MRNVGEPGRGGATARSALGLLALGLIAGGAACTRPDEDRAVTVTPGASSGAGSDVTAPGGASSGAGSDVTAPGGAASGAGSAGTAPLYPRGPIHSPLTAGVVARLRAVGAGHPELGVDRFAKVGDSITASGDFLRCFAGKDVDLGAHGALAPTLARLRGGDAGGVSPFLRESEAAVIGWSAWQAVHGERPPLVRELGVVKPRWALVQYGTNDIQMRSAHGFGEHLLRVVDATLAAGVVPVLFSVPPRVDLGPSDGETARHNAAIRGLAQLRRVPLVDYHQALLGLPGVGMAWDGIHPSVKPLGGGRAPCDLGADGLRYGYNLRNLLALEALHRLITVVAGEGALPDAEPPPLPGAGTAGAPFELALPTVVTLPVAARGDAAPAAALAGEACRGRPTGPALHFTLRLEAPRAVELLGFDHDGAEVDLFRLEPAPGATAPPPPDAPGGTWRCAERATRTLAARLPAGEHRFVAASAGPAGAFILAALAAP